MAQEQAKQTEAIPTKDVETAIKQFNDNSTAVKKASDYYAGEHELKFATDKFKNAFGSLFKTFALNLCPAICDAVRDKLVVSGFRLEAGEEGEIPKTAWKLWQNNRMDILSGEIHKEAMISGDAYAIVWVDAEKRLTVYPNKAANCTIKYDTETPGKKLWAAKHWLTDEKKVRLNLYYPEQTLRLISKNKHDSGMLPEAKEFVMFDKPVPNPYGQVPVFHFANNGEIGSFGSSEIKQAMPVQDALNKSVLDMLVTMEFASYRQRWAAGIEIEIDDEGKAKPPFTAGVDKLWLTENAETKFGDFEVTDLEQFLKVKDAFKVDLAHVTGTPLYYFMQTGGSFPSGEALKKSETRFINKVIDRQKTFGAVWADLMAFALMIEGQGEAIRLFTEWEDPAPLSEKEALDNLLVKQDLGVSDEQLLIEAGYGEEDVRKMLEAKAAKAEEAARSFNAGEDVGDEPPPSKK